MKLNEMERTSGSPLVATLEHGADQRERSMSANRATWSSMLPRISLPSIVTWSLVGVLLLFCYHTKNSARSSASADANSAQTSVGP